MANIKWAGKWAGRVAAVAALAAWVGCGGDSAGSSGGPSAAVALEAQKGQVASNSVQQTVTAGSNSVVESGAPGTTGTKSAQSTSAPAATFNFQASVNLTVDLGALNSSGKPIYPNASGQFSLSANGTLAGNSAAGTASYAVSVVWLTNGVFTDPVCGDQATIAAGSQLSYNLSVQWTYTDSLNWTVLATSDTNGACTVTVTDPSGTWIVNGTVQRHGTISISESAGVWSLSLSVTGDRTLVVTQGTLSHSVDINVQALDQIFITVDGVQFGPFTILEIRLVFGVDCQP